MKISRYFLIGCLALLIGCLLVVTNRPKHFVWNESYNTASSQPFGTLLFDSVMKKAMPQGYQTEDIYNEENYLREALEGREYLDTNLLIIDKKFSISTDENCMLLSYARQGGKVLIVASSFETISTSFLNEEDAEDEEPDTANTALSVLYDLQDNEYKQYVPLTIIRSLAEQGYDAFTFKSTLLAHGPYPETAVKLARPFVANHFYSDVAKNKGLQPLDSFRTNVATFPINEKGNEWSLDNNIVERQVELTSAVKRKVGKGYIIFTTAAPYFTNYGMTSKDGRTYVLRLMNEIADKPVVRILRNRQYQEPAEAEMGIYAYTMQHPALSLALRLAAIGVLLALVVNARRRSRAIPLKKLQPNVTLHFFRQVALLYRANANYTDLLHKRFLVFAADVKRRTGINMAETSALLTDDDLQRLSRHMRQKPQLLRGTLLFLNEHLTRETPVTYRQYRDCVNDINRLTKML